MSNEIRNPNNEIGNNGENRNSKRQRSHEVKGEGKRHRAAALHDLAEGAARQNFAAAWCSLRRLLQEIVELAAFRGMSSWDRHRQFYCETAALTGGALDQDASVMGFDDMFHNA